MNEKCRVLDLFSFIAKKWNLLILKSLYNWTSSFNKIKSDIWEINQKILSQRLWELEDYGFVKRKIISERPVKIEYSLTEKWKSFWEQLENLAKWKEKWD